MNPYPFTKTKSKIQKSRIIKKIVGKIAGGKWNVKIVFRNRLILTVFLREKQKVQKKSERYEELRRNRKMMKKIRLKMMSLMKMMKMIVLDSRVEDKDCLYDKKGGCY